VRRACLLLFLATVGLNWPQLPFNARFTDVVFVAAAIGILAQQKHWSPRLMPLDVAIAGYLAGSAAAAIFSPEPGVSGVELIRHLYVVAIYGVIAVAVRQGFAVTVASGLALSGAALATLGLIAFIVKTFFDVGATALTPVTTLPYIGQTLRLRALTASESMFACVLAMSIPFAVRHPFVLAARTRVAGSGVLLGAAALLTYSHSVAGVAVSTLITAWRSLHSHLTLRAAAVVLTILVVSGLNLAATIAVRSLGASSLRDNSVFQYGVDHGRAQVAGVEIEYQTMSYLRIKQVAWDAFMSRPLIGIGLDRFHSVTEIAFAEGRLTAPYRAIDPHSTFFGRFAEAGLIGGITLIVLWLAIAAAVQRLWSGQADSWIVIAVTAGIAGTFVNSMNADVMNFRFLWVALGLVRGLTVSDDRERA